MVVLKPEVSLVRQHLLAVLAGALLMSSATGWADDAQVEEGQELYGEFCQNCHGPDKSGLQKFTGDMTALTERLEGMTDEMPDFAGFFEEAEIEALYAYLTAPE